MAPVELPCGHAYCGACLAELRVKKVAQACPLCRTELPPGLDGLYELAYRATRRIEGMVNPFEVAWASLPAAEQEEVDQAEAMLAEAVAQGHAKAPSILGFLLHVRGDLGGATAAYRAAIAADSVDADAHYNLGVLLQNGRGDIDGAEAAYRVAIAADPGCAYADCNLGNLLANKRGDLDGAEAAYRAAIAADPGCAYAHGNLGFLLHERASQLEQTGGDQNLAVAAALHGECAELWALSKGADHELTRGALAAAAIARKVASC